LKSLRLAWLVRISRAANALISEQHGTLRKGARGQAEHNEGKKQGSKVENSVREVAGMTKKLKRA
jgi:hypothetical protein